jgi:branched-chain amino acid aminotransferase
MINLNGDLIDKYKLGFKIPKRNFDFANAVLDVLKYKSNTVYFIEDHYFRLMSSMRMIRMKIPLEFTLDFYEEQILKTIKEVNSSSTYQIRVTVYREDRQLINQQDNSINFAIEANIYTNTIPKLYEIDLYKDFYIFSGLLSTLKTTNQLIFDLASIYAAENDFKNSILINEKKNVVQVVDANIFLIKGMEILTPPLSEGCINGIMRKKIIDLLNLDKSYTIKEKSISPFELLHADEFFITNSIIEIQSISKYRKKIYQTKEAENIKRLFSKEFV